jgi:hypothetical protein
MAGCAAEKMAAVLEHPVVDKTGVGKQIDFRLDFARPNAAPTITPATVPSLTGGDPGPRGKTFQEFKFYRSWTSESMSYLKHQPDFY